MKNGTNGSPRFTERALREVRDVVDDAFEHRLDASFEYAER